MIKDSHSPAHPESGSPRSLADLIATWHAKADEQMSWSRQSDAKQDGANSHTERARARIYRECAEDLLAVVRSSLRQKNDDQDQARFENATMTEAVSNAELLFWFVERQHPTDYGYIQVRPFDNKAEAEALLASWEKDRPDLHPRIWERPPQPRDIREVDSRPIPTESSPVKAKRKCPTCGESCAHGWCGRCEKVLPDV